MPDKICLNCKSDKRLFKYQGKYVCQKCVKERVFGDETRMEGIVPETWKSNAERPGWCLIKDCIILRCSQEEMCCGVMPVPGAHTVATANFYRICLHDAVTDLQVNMSDLQGLRYIFDTIDGEKTCWQSKGVDNDTDSTKDVRKDI